MCVHLHDEPVCHGEYPRSCMLQLIVDLILKVTTAQQEEGSEDDTLITAHPMIYYTTLSEVELMNLFINSAVDLCYNVGHFHESACTYMYRSYGH